MGADQNLIRAAAQMGPKPFDYSGIMKAIASIGKFMAAKNAVAQEVLGQGRKMFKAVPSEVFEGQYGEANLSFITTKKNEYAAAYETMKKAFPGSKKYKDALRSVNSIKTILEKNKAGLIKWEEIRDKAESGDLLNNMSAGNGSVSHSMTLDIVNNSVAGSLNEDIIFTDNGVFFKNDELNRNISVYDLLNGYKEKSPFLSNATIDIVDVINKYGKTPAEGEKPLDIADAKAEISAILEEAGESKNGGFNSVRSLAYDFKYDGQTYVTANQKEIIGLSDKDIAAANPEVTDDDALLMIKQNLLADAYGTNNTKALKAGLESWLYGLVEDKYRNTQPLPSKSGQLQLGLIGANNTSLYMDAREKEEAIKGLKNKTSFFIDGTEISWSESKQGWMYNDYAKGATLIPSDSQERFDAGSPEALLFRFKNDPDIAKALGLGSEEKEEQTQAQIDSTQAAQADTTLPILEVDTIQK